MENERRAVLNNYYQKSRNKCLALKNWLQRMNKDQDISLIDALDCIYNAADGKVTVMDDIITRLTDKKKFFGRTQYSTTERSATNGMDLRKNPDGTIELIGYSTDIPLTKKGQHLAVNPDIVRKSDNQVSRIYHNTERRLNDIGAWVRSKFPNANVVYIARMINSIRKYAAEHKISAERTCMLIDKGRLAFDDNDTVVPVRNESKENTHRHIIISEKAARFIADNSKMPEGRFYANIKYFIHGLILDPDAPIPSEFSQRGYTKSRLIQILINNGLLEKEMRVSDKDPDGELKLPTMLVKYKSPKDGFNRKLYKLYIKMFERNVPEPVKRNKNITEEGEGGGFVSGGATSAEASGAFVGPVFSMQRKKMPTDEATLTTTVGNFQYTVPFAGDDETMARHNGEGGSVSINHTK